jgi:hypothetical protein
MPDGLNQSKKIHSASAPRRRPGSVHSGAGCQVRGLPDGGSDGAAKVVPGHFGRDWAAEIARRDIRMKET